MEPDLLIEGIAELIRRTVGPDIAVELRLEDGVWTVLCDPPQLESALLNLTINARDAMPEGGRLNISTADIHLSQAPINGQDDVRPGDYVEITVADTGAGMDEATKARAFEPFFTTKPLGQGTGLGLSQVYGFVRQSGGVVRLNSALGQGTTVQLFLPRHALAPTRKNAAIAKTELEKADTNEVVLLVEDEENVRATTAEQLRERGYCVFEAEDGPAALDFLRSGMHLDVLVTDVGLPGGMNGRQIADMARYWRPHLPVLFITGYAGSALKDQLAAGMGVMNKPFTLDALITRVRMMLERQSHKAFIS